jgi:hypothetical protein
MAPSPPSPKSSIRSYGATENCDTQSEVSYGSVHGTDYQGQNRGEPSSDRARRKSFIEQDEEPLQIEPPTMKKKDETVSWMDLPCKSQLAILTLARLSEPLTQTSLRVRTLSPHHAHIFRSQKLPSLIYSTN